jgi:hypothetical protein
LALLRYIIEKKHGYREILREETSQSAASGQKQTELCHHTDLEYYRKEMARTLADFTPIPGLDSARSVTYVTRTQPTTY